ncbi:MAG: hypothetical protein ACRC3H_17025 [Lachnospiraceae bacterium]
MSKIKYGKVTSEQLYLGALALYVFLNMSILGVQWNSPFSTIKNLLQIVLAYVIPVLLVTRLALGVFKKKKTYHFLCILVISCLGYSGITIHDNTLVYTAAFILLAKDIDFDKIIKIFYKVALFSIVLLTVASIIGTVQNNGINFSYSWGTVIGYTMGTSHSNNFAAYMMTCLFLWVYKNRFIKSSIKLISISIITGFLIFFLTASRTSAVVVFAFGIICILFEFMKKVKAEKLINFLKASIVMVFAVSIYFMNSMDGQAGVNLLSDLNFAHRFSSAYSIYLHYGIRPFGSNIEFVSSIVSAQTGKPSVILDSAYLNLVLYRGYIATTLFIFAIIILYKKIGNARDYMLMIIISLYIIGGLMEQNVFLVYSNFTLLGTFATLRVSENTNWYSSERRRRNVRWL